MSTTKILFIITFFFSISLVDAQIIKKVVDKAEKKIEHETEKRTEKRVNKGIDKVFDKTEEAIDKSIEGENKSGNKGGNKGEVGNNNNSNSNSNSNNNNNSNTQQEPTLTWNKYDFVPGTEIIFEDNQQGEQNGEFPSKWDLKAGTVENAFFDNNNVIFFRQTGNQPNGIIPLVENRKFDYLPEEFTLEFDAFYASNKYNQYYTVAFYDVKNQKNNNMKYLKLGVNNAQYGDFEKMYPGAKSSNIDTESKWRHIAISFNKRALKVYMDDARLLNIPNIEQNPTGISIGANNHSDGQFFIKNVRIAKGAVPLYDKFLTDGKFITTGIKFDVAKATIKPESMGTINYVVKMMQDHPELKFRVEGHTDSDGDDASNLKLSENRAKAVMDKLIEMGIDKSRLSYKGHGESLPVASNETSEGKAQNRRVEFIQIK